MKISKGLYITLWVIGMTTMFLVADANRRIQSIQKKLESHQCPCAAPAWDVSDIPYIKPE